MPCVDTLFALYVPMERPAPSATLTRVFFKSRDLENLECFSYGHFLYMHIHHNIANPRRTLAKRELRDCSKLPSLLQRHLWNHFSTAGCIYIDFLNLHLFQSPLTACLSQNPFGDHRNRVMRFSTLNRSRKR